MFFFEAKTLGKWHPRTSRADPMRKGGGNYRQTIRGVTEIPQYLEQLTLEQLREVFSVDGKFYAETKRELNR